MTENPGAPEDSASVQMANTEPRSVTGSAYDARLAVDTTPTLGRSAYDAFVQVDTSPPARIEPVAAPAPTSDSAPTASSGE